jgi:hypothetical protein
VLLKWSRPEFPALQIQFPQTEVMRLSIQNAESRIILATGPSGPPGPSGTTASSIELEVSVPGQQQIILDRPVSSGLLFLNGLMQSPQYYILSGTNLTIPSQMGCMPLDVINFTY